MECIMSLQVGSQGKAVADVQEALKRHGFVAADRAGVFSGNTADAVRAFQTKRGLPATAVVDQATWRALGLRGSVPRPGPID
jgi:peptidoglycan hydrolase-like protein with peptidoglycan-binding domain